MQSTSIRIDFDYARSRLHVPLQFFLDLGHLYADPVDADGLLQAPLHLSKILVDFLPVVASINVVRLVQSESRGRSREVNIQHHEKGDQRLG